MRRRPFPFPPRPRRALTLVEVLVALAVASLLMGIVLATFVALLRTAEESEIQLRATANARAALESLSNDLKAALGQPGTAFFQGLDAPLPAGDGVDNDGDGRIDEEAHDGRDNDVPTDWTDQHLAVGALSERSARVGTDDLGDFGVDEDCVFDSDMLRFRARMDASGTLALVDYSIQEFDGQSRALVRATTSTLSGYSAAPAASEVLSFSVLYWNPNAPAADQYWATEWESLTPPGPGPRRTFRVPAAVYLEITVYADSKPFEDYREGDPVRTVTLRSLVNLEEVILDRDFPRAP